MFTKQNKTYKYQWSLGQDDAKRQMQEITIGSEQSAERLTRFSAW